jgi:hypothetical protein
MAGDVDAQQSAGDQLPKDRAPFLLAEFPSDTERRQSVMTESGHAFGFRAHQHVDHMAGAKALPGSINAG